MSLKQEIRQHMKGVVQIHVEGYLGDEIRYILNPRLTEVSVWTGSGFFVDHHRWPGHIVTNTHVVKNAKFIEISSMLTSEERFDAELVGLVKGMEPDIALIKLKDDEFARFMDLVGDQFCALNLPKESGPIETISRGMEIKAIGYPLGMMEPNITAGEITNFLSGNKVEIEKYVTDAAINPGNSGGPSISNDGVVVGINTAIIKDASNIGFITPSSFLTIFLENLNPGNDICFCDVGGDVQKNSAELAKYLGQEGVMMGIVVIKVEKGGMFEKAKVEVGDILLSINDHLFDRHGIVFEEDRFHHRNIFDIVKLLPLGKEVKFKVLRKGKELILTGPATPAPFKAVKSNPLVKERLYMDFGGTIIQELSLELIEAFHAVDSSIGIELIKEIDAKKPRIIVTSIEKGSMADRLEWGIGEIIDTVNGVEIEGLKDFSLKLGQLKQAGKNEIVLRCRSGLWGPFQLENIPSLELMSKVN